MNRGYFVYMILLTVMMIITIPSISAYDVMKISDFNMTVDLDKNPAHVSNVFVIKNLVHYPLVPGIGEFRLQKEEYDKIFIVPLPLSKKKVPMEVSNLKGYYRIGNNTKLVKMKTYSKVNGNYTTIYYEVWEPIEKGQTLTVYLDYDAKLLDDGLLFKTLTLPIGCDMDIDNLNIKFKTKLHETYQKPEGNNFKVPQGTLFMLKAEFTSLPLPKLPTYGYVLFWSIIILILIIILAYGELKRSGNKNKDNKNNNKDNDNNDNSNDNNNDDNNENSENTVDNDKDNDNSNND